MTLVEPYRAVSSESVLRHLRILKDRKPDVLLVPNLLEDIVDTLGKEAALVSVSTSSQFFPYS